MIEDEWVTGNNKVEASFQWVTAAKVTKQRYGILLEQNGKKLMRNISIAGFNELPLIEIEDVSKAKNLRDSDNPGVSRISIKLKTPAQSKSILKVIAVPERTGN